MKMDLAITKNVQRGLACMEQVKQHVRGRRGNGLIYGREGTGKTEFLTWYANKQDIPYVRCRKGMSQRGLLSAIVGELGEAPVFKSEALFEQLIEVLFDNPVPIIVDEVDYLVPGGVVEVLRDINDTTNTPIILAGMGELEKKLKRLPHLYDRFTCITQFQLFDAAEIKGLAGNICEIPLTDDAIRLIAISGQGKLRLTTTWFARAEQFAKRNGLEEVTAEHLRQFEGGNV